MSNDQMAAANNFLMSGGSKSFPFESINDTVQGEVISAEMRQQTDVDTGEKLTWNDGTPRMQLMITLQTQERADDDDDGVRVVYAKGGKHDLATGEGLSMKEAIAKAVKEAGATGIEPGDMLAVAFTGLGQKKNRAFNAPKLYSASFRKASRAVSGADLFDS